MLIDLKVWQWKVLRTLVRAKKPVQGINLRINYSQRTKGDKFLFELLIHGLIACDGNSEPLVTRSFTLTERGKKAAEYGEYEIPFSEYKANCEECNAKRSGKCV